ncbi:MAG: MazG-like family protein [Defluviitaleaceae bacterium]|nr:MazG-like family protein [Defluviitaleaceae bacterium]
MQAGDFDITGMLKALDEQKLGLLQSVVDLHKNMADPHRDREERLRILSGILVRAYMLSARLGIDPAALDDQAADDLRVHISKHDEVLAADYAALLRHIRRRQP